MFAQGLSTERGEQVEAFSFDPGFIRDLYVGDGGGDRAMLGLAFKLALAGLGSGRISPWSQCYVVVSEAARRLGVRGGFSDEVRLREFLGENLSGEIDRYTWELLLDAEANWARLEHSLVKDDDYRVIGLGYRCALEHEWRGKIGRALSACDSRVHPSRATLGEMVRTVYEKAGSPIGRQVLKSRLPVHGKSRLFDQLFMSRARDVLEKFLNAAAHPGGLDRATCREFRRRLLEEGMLRDLLASVQRK
jgi:hypothetical protein